MAEEGAGGAAGIAGHEGELVVGVSPRAVQDPTESVRHQQCLWEYDWRGLVTGIEHPWTPSPPGVQAVPGSPLLAQQVANLQLCGRLQPYLQM